MKKTIQILTLCGVLATSIFAKSTYELKYQLHSNIYDQSIDISNANKKEIFFGTKQDYYKHVSKGLKQIQLKGLDGAINATMSQSANIAKGFLETAGKGIALGAAIGGIIGAIDLYIKESRKAAEYIYVVEFITPNGKKTTGSVLLSSQIDEFKESPNMDKIKTIMKREF